MSRVLAFVDVLDGDHVRQSFPVHAPADDGASVHLRIGRQLDCHIALDDPHLAPEHALLSIGPEPLAQLTLLPSLNGAQQGRRHHRSGERLDWPADSHLQLGHTRLRLRHSAAALAPERAALHAPKGLGLALLVVAMLLVFGLDTWLSRNPGDGWQDYLGPMMGLGAAVAAWAGLWALLTQLFQRRFPFAMHLRRALLVLLGLTLADWLLPALAFMASAPWLLVPEKLLPVLGGVGLLVWHARDVWPRARLFLTTMALGGLALWFATGWTRQEPLQHRWRDPYVATLLPPQFRAAPLRSVDALLEDARALRPVLADKAKVDAQGNAVEDGEGEE